MNMMIMMMMMMMMMMMYLTLLKIHNFLYLNAIQIARREQNVVTIPFISHSLTTRSICPFSGCPTFPYWITGELN
jgi:hypothetical protein